MANYRSLLAYYRSLLTLIERAQRVFGGKESLPPTCLSKFTTAVCVFTTPCLSIFTTAVSRERRGSLAPEFYHHPVTLSQYIYYCSICLYYLSVFAVSVFTTSTTYLSLLPALPICLCSICLYYLAFASRIMQLECPWRQSWRRRR